MKTRLSIPEGLEGFVVHTQTPLVRYRSHRHEELEVNLVASGRAAYLFGKERVALGTGSLVWLFPDQEHVLIDCSPDFSIWVAVFTQKLVAAHSRHPGRRPLKAAHPGSVQCRVLPPESALMLEMLYRNTLSAWRGGDLDFANLALAHAMVASWQEYMYSTEAIALTNVHPAVARAVRAMAASDESLGLDRIAARAGLSSCRLSRLFKKQTGTTLTAFRQRRCFERFLQIYRNGARYSVTEAALMAGFGSYPQFHRIFRRLMGHSPAAYARSVKKAASSAVRERPAGG